MQEYNFDAKQAIDNIVSHMKSYCSYSKNPRAIIGISGGKDSSVCAALAVEAFGKENVTGIMMPNGVQKDISDSEKLISHLGINRKLVNIEGAYNALGQAICAGNDISEDNVSGNYQYRTNTPARLRMTTLYAFSALEGGTVICTDNRDESILGYSTLYGDCAGSYAPLSRYTVTEVRKIGDALGLPHDLVHKLPSDGMCGSTDEENLSVQLDIKGFTYERLDTLIRGQEHDFTDTEIASIEKKYKAMEFKRSIVQIPCPEVQYFDYFNTVK